MEFISKYVTLYARRDVYQVKKMEITSYIILGKNGIKLEIYRKKTKKKEKLHV